ncbi:MAG: hypothetical protein H8E72_02315 [Candidatus Marinimicrobia bacterium]|nr:hypothetical protein [Candidatus Neomarinimicrobiota bacterium]
MKLLKFTLLISLLTISFAEEKEGSSTSASMGSVTMDGKIYNQVAIRPEIPMGKMGVGLDLYVYFNDEGIYPGNWDFKDGNAFATLVDKVYYLRWGKPGDNLYFKVGALPSATLGQGILVNNYSNIMEYPQVRRVGLDFKMKFMKQFGVELIHSNFKKSSPGVLATRFSYDPFPRLSLGLSYVTDLDQNQGLSNRDGDDYPDYFDHFPDDANQFSEALSDTSVTNYYTYLWETYVEPAQDTENPEYSDYESFFAAQKLNHNTFVPLGTSDNNPVSGLSLDLVLKLSKRAYIYSQYGQLIGETSDVNGNETALGYGLVPIGLFSKFGPINFRGEYRMQSENFLFSYWDQAYDLNRAIAQDGIILTKESQLYRYGELQGLFLNLNSNIMDLISLDVSYQNMSGKVWDETTSELVDDANQTLMGKISLNTRKIAKVDVAEAFYQQSNVTNPFDFDPNESSISGYNLGFEVSAGMTLMYKSRTTYVLNESGTFDPVSSMQIETQIKL